MVHRQNIAQGGTLGGGFQRRDLHHIDGKVALLLLLQ